MDNKLSIWFGKEIIHETDEDEVDLLKDLCGVEYYDIDFQEIFFVDGEVSDLETLLEPLSYSETFMKEVIKKANNLGITEASYALVQDDFGSEDTKMDLPKDSPIFVGVFDYIPEDEERLAGSETWQAGETNGWELRRYMGLR